MRPPMIRAARSNSSSSSGIAFNERQRKASSLTELLLSLLLLRLLIACFLISRTIDAAPIAGRSKRYEDPDVQPEVPVNLEEDELLPTFEQTASNVTAFEGQTVYLPCRVHNLADKVVSWMRSRDLHIITSGEFTFSSDERFKPQHLAGSDAWTLQLDHVRKSDAGRYECQVNTEPKIMYAVQLTVRDPNKPDGYDEPHSQQTRVSFESTAPVAAIMGPREQTLPAGSTITLKCVVTSPYQTRPIKGLQWLRDNKLLTFQAARGGINVETVTGTAQTFSEATLANLTSRDTGKYSCRPLEGRADTIFINVQDLGEHVEAMQRDAPSYSSTSAADAQRSIDLLSWLLASYLIFNAFIHRSICTLSTVLP